jgi:NADP-dependent 3-hydroxy acid dehydrogenase YdfG
MKMQIFKPASKPVTSPKVWFITGASRGFGRVWADAALKRGDKVAATARKLESIADLKGKIWRKRADTRA